jgi:hypothetical protein
MLLSLQRSMARLRRLASPRPRRIVLQPSLFRVTLLSNTSARIDVQFSDTVDADKVKIYRSEDGAAYSLIATLDVGSSVIHIDDDLEADTCYWWKAVGVINYTAGGVARTLTSAFSNVEIKTTTNTTPALVQPAGIVITQTGLTATEYTVRVDWDSVPNKDGYYRYFTGGYVAADIDDPTSGTENSAPGIVIPRQVDDAVATVHVMAVNGSGRGPENTKQFTIPGNLKAPDLQITRSGSNAIVTVVPPVSGSIATLYRVERDSGDGFEQVTEFAADATAPQFVDEALDDGVYQYRGLGVNDETLDEETGDPIEKLSNYSAIQTVEINASAEVPPDRGQDFEAMTSIGDLDAAFNNRAPANIVYDDGSLTPYGEVGLLFRYIAKPDQDSDQALFLEIDTPQQFEAWTEQNCVISPEWTTINTNFTTIPNYKLQIFHLRPLAAMLSGRARAEVQMGQGAEGRNMGATGTGYPTFTGEAEAINPNAFLSASPIDATTLPGSGRVRIRNYFRIFQDNGVWKETMIQSVNGVVTFAWTAFAGNPGAATLSRLSLGGARSMGSMVEAYIHQKSWWIWDENNDPNWPEFTGTIPTDYTQ